MADAAYFRVSSLVDLPFPNIYVDAKLKKLEISAFIHVLPYPCS